jgi:predicted nucleotidyltransferase
VQVTDDLIAEIVRRLLDAQGGSKIVKIILFGSAATGAMTRDSDIDLLVLERSPGDARRESVRLRAALRGMGFPFDVIVMDEAYFERTKRFVGGLAHPANKYGRAVYAPGI